MEGNHEPMKLLIAENDNHDCSLFTEAFQECGYKDELIFVADGIELIRNLDQTISHSRMAPSKLPDLILINREMPQKDGFTTLAEIKSDPGLRYIPVVMLDTATDEADVLRAYDLGAAGVIVKPTNLVDMVEVVKVINQYWFEVVELSSYELFKSA